MKRDWKVTKSFLAVLLSMALTFSLVSCGGGGGGGTSGPAPATTTTISGKVTLSSTVTGKPAMLNNKTMSALSKVRKAGKPDSNPMKPSQMDKVLQATGVNLATALTYATVEVYNADKSEWLYPVAVTQTDINGNYTVDKLTNAASNGNAYTDGAEIPVGNYTIITSKYDVNYGSLFVAVQAVVKKFEGAVAGNDLTAQDSDGIPAVTSMFGLSENTDGTYGSTSTSLPANAAIQVTFSTAMARLGLIDAISIKDSAGNVVSGSWKISADLISATFVPASSLTADETYSVTILGGKAAKAAKSVYGKALTADVKGSFKAATADVTPPGAVKDSPSTSTNVTITTPIRFAANEPIDINAITVISSPSIGDRPFIQYVGKIGKYLDYNYVYEVVPANALKVNTTYSLSVSGGKDLAGLSMDTLSFSFTTEATSAGVTGTTTTEVDAQVAVKDGFGKWVRALNDRNMTQLTSIMTGDFFWLASGKDYADLNGDGRLSLKEFTDMLSMWMDQLEVCGSTVSGDVVSINVSGSSAVMAFNLTVTSTNGAVSSCSQGPDNTLYAVFQNINGAWLMVMGSDAAITTATIPAPMTPISLVSPAADAKLPEPTSTQPLLPDFKWTGVSGITTYALIVVDTKSRENKTGWIALIDGANTGGKEVSAKFTPKTGLVGSMYVVPAGGTLGFDPIIESFDAGGSYSWAVIGFKTKTISDFSKQLVTDPLSDIGASSDGSNFSVLGNYNELSVTVKDATTGLAYDYSDMMYGYNVGNASAVTLTIQAPVGSTATTAYVQVSGYKQNQYTATFTTGGIATVSNIALSDNGNWVQISDMPRDTQTYQFPAAALVKEFSIVTTGGAEPLINITSVTGKKCDSSAATLSGPNLWNDYSSADVCTVDITGTVTGITGTLNLQVWSDTGQYRSQLNISGTNFTFNNVPVYNGWNSVNIADMNWTNMNHIGIDNAGTGSVYVPAINITSVTAATALTPTYTSLEGAYYDAGSSASVTIAGTMQSVSTSCAMGPCSGWNQNDANWQFITGGQITSSPFSISANLYQGWNYIGFSDANNNYYMLSIYTTGGAAYTQPNEITSVTDSNGPITADGTGVYNTTQCSVTINGTTTSLGSPLYASLYYYNSTGGQSINEYPSTQPVSNSTDGTYSITFPVYSGGENWINVNDSNWNWAGVSVKTTGTCTATAFGITSVSTAAGGLTKDIYGEYNAGSAATVTIAGNAATGKSVSIYVSGLYYDTFTTTAANNAFSQSVKIYNGYNYISITDGSNWEYLTVYTTGGSTYTEPFKITSVTSTDGTVVADDTTGYSYSGTATTVILSGETTKSGTVYWYGGGSSGSFNVTAGAFTSVPITLWYGSNYVDLYLYPADGSYSLWDGIFFYTTGGTGAPVKIVQITSPAQGASISSATGGVVSTPVTGTIDLSKYDPSRTALYVYGYVYDFNTSQYTNFSNQVSDQTNFGDSPITVDGSGNFSLTALINSNSPSYIEVYAYDDITWMGHGHQIYVNNIYNYSDFFWKPGSKNTKAKAGAAREKAHKAEFLKKVMKRK